MIAFITERIKNRPTIGVACSKWGSRWIRPYCLDAVSPVRRNPMGNHGSVKFDDMISSYDNIVNLDINIYNPDNYTDE